MVPLFSLNVYQFYIRFVIAARIKLFVHLLLFCSLFFMRMYVRKIKWKDGLRVDNFHLGEKGRKLEHKCGLNNKIVKLGLNFQKAHIRALCLPFVGMYEVFR